MIREAIRKEGMVALGKVVFTSREHIIALEARGKGMMGVTLRYPYEVRDEKRNISTTSRTRKSQRTCSTSRSISSRPRPGNFKPDEFEDQYEDALKELLRKKQKGEKIEAPTSASRRMSST